MSNSFMIPDDKPPIYTEMARLREGDGELRLGSVTFKIVEVGPSDGIRPLPSDDIHAVQSARIRPIT